MLRISCSMKSHKGAILTTHSASYQRCNLLVSPCLELLDHGATWRSIGVYHPSINAQNRSAMRRCACCVYEEFADVLLALLSHGATFSDIELKHSQPPFQCLSQSGAYLTCAAACLGIYRPYHRATQPSEKMLGCEVQSACELGCTARVKMACLERHPYLLCPLHTLLGAYVEPYD